MDQFKGLNDKQQRLLSKLLKVEGESIYAVACRNITTAEGFFNMVDHLLDQLPINPKSLKKILGEGAFDALIHLEEAMTYGNVDG